MTINLLIVKNFKCFEELQLTLKDGLNILYGTNGTGKTAVLEALCIAAGSFFMKLSEVEKRDFKVSDIRLAFNDDIPSYQFPVEIITYGKVMNEQINWTRTLNTIEGGITSTKAREIAKLSERTNDIIQTNEAVILPLIAYFSTQRLFSERKESKKTPIGRLSAYYNALNATSTRKYIQAWFRDAEFEQYQKRQTQANYTNVHLESIKQLVLAHFDEWQRFYYYEPATNSRIDNGLFFVHKDGRIIPENLLSDGYRNFLWLLLDIAWRCHILNPFLNEKAATETNGIVLIDEIELHLHPKWQQRIADVLTSAFPQLQFVLTTHSPIVLGSEKANVLLLNNNEVRESGNLYGAKPSFILETFMDVQERLPKLSNIIKQYLVLVSNGKGTEKEASELREKLNENMSPNDPLFAEADALIHFYSL